MYRIHRTATVALILIAGAGTIHGEATAAIHGMPPQFTIRGMPSQQVTIRMILERFHAAAKRAKTARSLAVFTAHGQTEGGDGPTHFREHIYVHNAFSTRLPERQASRIVLHYKFGSSHISAHEHEWVHGNKVCNSGHDSFPTDGLWRGSYPLSWAGAWMTGARLVGPSVTYGVPTWFIRVTYIEDPAKVGVMTSRVNEFVSQKTYRLVKLATYGSAVRSGLKAMFSIVERFGHYGKSVNTKFPKSCGTSSDRTPRHKVHLLTSNVVAAT